MSYLPGMTVSPEHVSDDQIVNPVCYGCPFRKLPEVVYVPPEGELDRPIVMVGESPGRDEMVAGRPFIGRSGALVQTMMERSHLNRDYFYITNACNCGIHNDAVIGPDRANEIIRLLWEHNGDAPREKPRSDELERCLRPLCGAKLDWELRGAQSDVVLLLGAKALKAAFDDTTLAITRKRGSPMRGKHNKIYFPVLHPAFILRNQAAYSLFEADWARFATVDLAGARLPDVTVETFDTIEELEEWCTNELPSCELFTWDLETTGLNPREGRITAMGLCTEESSAKIIPVDHPNKRLIGKNVRPRLMAAIRTILTSSARKITHNGQFDIQWLWAYGMDDFFPVDGDTMVANHLVDENLSGAEDPSAPQHGAGHSLNTLIGLRLNWPRYDEDVLTQVKANGGYEHVEWNTLASYCGLDCIATYRLAHIIEPEIPESARSLYQDILIPRIEVLAEMEYVGMLLDSECAGDFEKEYADKVQDLAHTVQTCAGVTLNLNSTTQLQDLLFETLRLPVVSYTKKGNMPSTDKEAIRGLLAYVRRFPENASLPDPHTTHHTAGALARMLDDLKQYKRLSKLKGTYIRGQKAESGMLGKLEGDGRIHASYHGSKVVTGRLSSSNPNMQNVPKDLRRMFVAPPGHVLVAADYSQAEFRIAGFLSGDEKINQVFAEGGDFHSMVAFEIYQTNSPTDQQRRYAKSLNFGAMYGGGAHTLSQSAEIPEFEAEQMISQFKISFQRLDAWFQEIIMWVDQYRWIMNIYGRVRRFIPADAGPLNAHARNQSVNFPMQSTVADKINEALVEIRRIMRAGGMGTKIAVQVHDEGVFCVPEDELDTAISIIRDRMESPLPGTDFSLPVDIVVGPYWGYKPLTEEAEPQLTAQQVEDEDLPF